MIDLTPKIQDVVRGLNYSTKMKSHVCRILLLEWAVTALKEIIKGEKDVQSE